MSFSTNMQSTVQNLLEKLGNRCMLSKVTTGDYDTTTGKTSEFREDVGTYYTSMKNSSLVLSINDPRNFNLSGFDENKVLIPFIQGYEIDDTWLFDGDPIETIEKIEAQDNLIAYIIKVKG